MSLPGAIILLVLLLLSIAALIGALMISRTVRLAMKHRVELVSQSTETPKDTDTIRMRVEARSKRLDAQIRRGFSLGTSRNWGMEMTAVPLFASAVVMAGSVWLLLSMGLGLSAWITMPTVAFSAFFMPRALLLRQQKSAERKFEDMFPDAVDAIGRMLRAGLPIISAVRSVGAEAAPPVSTVFALTADQVDLGVPIEDALDATSRQIGLADFRFFSVAVVLQHSTGGNLAATLETLTEIIRKRRAMRLKARATTAEIRISAYVLGSLPFLVIGTLSLIQPGYLTPLFKDPRGQVILGLAVGGLTLGILSIRQMMRSVTNA